MLLQSKFVMLFLQETLHSFFLAYNRQYDQYTLDMNTTISVGSFLLILAIIIAGVMCHLRMREAAEARQRERELMLDEEESGTEEGTLLVVQQQKEPLVVHSTPAGGAQQPSSEGPSGVENHHELLHGDPPDGVDLDAPRKVSEELLPASNELQEPKRVELQTSSTLLPDLSGQLASTTSEVVLVRSSEMNQHEEEQDVEKEEILEPAEIKKTGFVRRFLRMVGVTSGPGKAKQAGNMETSTALQNETETSRTASTQQPNIKTLEELRKEKTLQRKRNHKAKKLERKQQRERLFHPEKVKREKARELLAAMRKLRQQEKNLAVVAKDQPAVVPTDNAFLPRSRSLISLQSSRPSSSAGDSSGTDQVTFAPRPASKMQPKSATDRPATPTSLARPSSLLSRTQSSKDIKSDSKNSAGPGVHLQQQENKDEKLRYKTPLGAASCTTGLLASKKSVKKSVRPLQGAKTTMCATVGQQHSPVRSAGASSSNSIPGVEPHLFGVQGVASSPGATTRRASAKKPPVLKNQDFMLTLEPENNDAVERRANRLRKQEAVEAHGGSGQQFHLPGYNFAGGAGDHFQFKALKQQAVVGPPPGGSSGGPAVPGPVGGHLHAAQGGTTGVPASYSSAFMPANMPPPPPNKPGYDDAWAAYYRMLYLNPAFVPPPAGVAAFPVVQNKSKKHQQPQALYRAEDHQDQQQQIDVAHPQGGPSADHTSSAAARMNYNIKSAFPPATPETSSSVNLQELLSDRYVWVNSTNRRPSPSTLQKETGTTKRTSAEERKSTPQPADPLPKRKTTSSSFQEDDSRPSEQDDGKNLNRVDDYSLSDVRLQAGSQMNIKSSSSGKTFSSSNFSRSTNTATSSSSSIKVKLARPAPGGQPADLAAFSRNKVERAASSTTSRGRVIDDNNETTKTSHPLNFPAAASGTTTKGNKAPKASQKTASTGGGPSTSSGIKIDHQSTANNKTTNNDGKGGQEELRVRKTQDGRVVVSMRFSDSSEGSQ
ncbi:unnamed protein product [Amoebophrya sp. A120]|nr:unnamed protein product [Amoebophrya sp. A120]|eukprot:GSA120T00013301001.1